MQSWRSFEWRPEDLDATLILTFWPDDGGGRIELVQANAPDHLYETLLAGWPMRYWEPWQAYLEGGR